MADAAGVAAAAQPTCRAEARRMWDALESIVDQLRRLRPPDRPERLLMAVLIAAACAVAIAMVFRRPSLFGRLFPSLFTSFAEIRLERSARDLRSAARNGRRRRALLKRPADGNRLAD
jgi:hypothetical protein